MNWNRKQKIFLGGALVLLLLLGWAWKMRSSSSSDGVSYKEEKVTRGDLHITVLSTGVVQPENRVEIKPSIAGRAEKVLVQEGEKVHKGQVLMWTSSTERAALLDAARSKGPAEVAKWEEIYQPTPIVAPVSGTIIQRKIEPGQTFLTTDAVLVVSDRLIVEAQVDETDLSRIHLKQTAQLTLDSYPDMTIPGRVESIAYESTTVNNVTTYVVKVLPQQVPPTMRSGMTTNVKFEIDSREQALLISTAALKTSSGEAKVLVRDPETSQAVPRSVKAGLSDGKKTEIISGLDENETILIPGLTTDSKSRSEANKNPFGPPTPNRRQSNPTPPGP